MPSTRRALLVALTAGFTGCSGTRVRSPTRSSDTESETRTTPAGSTPTTTRPSTPPEQPEHNSLDDERLRWRVDIPGERLVTPAAADGRLYVASGDEQRATPTGTERSSGVLTALTLPDGEVEWYRSLDDPPAEAVRTHRGDAYLVVGRSTGFYGVDQRLVRVGSGGAERWQSSGRDKFVDVLDFDGETAYLGTSDDALSSEGETVFAVDLGTGTERWTAEAGDSFDGRVAGDTLYADYGGTAVASHATADGDVQWERSVEGLHSRDETFPAAAGNLFAAISRDGTYGIAGIAAEDGSTAWTYGLDAESPFVVSSATVVGDTVVGSEYDGLLFARDAATGDGRWEQSFENRLSAPLAADGTLYTSMVDGPVVAVDAESGAEQWREPVTGGGPARLWLAGETLLAATNSRGGTAIDAYRAVDGDGRWRRSVPGRVTGVSLTEKTLVVATDAGAVYGVDLGQPSTV